MRRHIKVITKLGFSRVIVTAGMRRSGSTLLYNILRLCLEHKYKDKLVANQLVYIDKVPKAGVYLFKTHLPGNLLRYRANTVFYSYRDIRDALISEQRIFGTKPSIEYCREVIKNDMGCRRNADAIFRFEHFVDNVEETIEIVAKKLKIKVNTEAIVSQLPEAWVNTYTEKIMFQGYDKKTLMFPGHATGTKVGEWRELLDEKLQKQISEEFGWWLQENNYELS